MSRRSLLLRISLRVAESLLLSALAGAFVWVVSRIVRLPLAFSALFGFLAGGTATMETAGVRIAGRAPRMALAALCATSGLLVTRVLDYARFVRQARGLEQARDYRITDPEADRMVQAGLRLETGHEGLLGHALSTLRSGVAVGPFLLRGASAVAYVLVEAALALAIAVRWAGGPAPRRSQA